MLLQRPALATLTPSGPKYGAHTSRLALAHPSPAPTAPLQALDDPLEEMEKLAMASGVKGCAYCGGLGHRIGDCPKLKGEAKEQSKVKKDYFGASGGIGGEM
jgi:hypothetical protein